MELKNPNIAIFILLIAKKIVSIIEFYRKRSSQLSNLVQSNGTENKDEEKIVIGQNAQDGVNMAVDAGAGITYGKYLQVNCYQLFVYIFK